MGVGFWFVVCFFLNLGGGFFFAFSFSHFKDVNALSCVEKVKVGPYCHLILYSRGVHLNHDLGVWTNILSTNLLHCLKN